MIEVNKTMNEVNTNTHSLPITNEKGLLVTTLKRAAELLNIPLRELERVFRSRWCNVPYEENEEIGYERNYLFKDIASYAAHCGLLDREYTD